MTVEARTPRVSALAPAAAAATGILVGVATVATKSLVDQTGPASLALLRYSVGLLCLLPPTLLSDRPAFDRRDLPPIALLGIAQFGLLIVLLNVGLRFIPSARAALIFATTPLLTMILAAALGFERLSLAQTTGVLLTLAGVGLALGEKVIQRVRGPEAWVGELAVLGSALIAAACSLLYRPYLRKYPALPLSALAMLAAVVFLAALAAGEGFFASPPGFSPASWLAVLVIGVSSGVGYFLWLWALNNATPTRVTVFLALGPVTASGLGALLLAEAISPLFLAGLACLVVGLWLAHLQVAAAGERW